MTLRNASGKFGLPFGRKSDGAGGNGAQSNSTPPSRVASHSYSNSQHNTTYSGEGDSLPSPTALAGGAGGGSAGGFGRKLGKSIAHTSLIPSLGNQDLRHLQDVINAEKSVLTSTERLAVDMQTAASRLAPYGQQEGPDLQDVLGHSATLLSQVSVALRTFAQHESSMRACFKRIREREEALDELRRHRRHIGSKAEGAEKKLAKMGPENKQLSSQTELLESLRYQMRQLDSDIINEETKNGDFKRQAVKEAMSFKFGGLEELGEKMCIVGELGKLILEEIPLEETPPGYNRAPYNSHTRTQNTSDEAVKCLATVQFHAASAEPKAPGLPRLSNAGSLQAPSLPRQHSIDAHEEFERLPGNPQSPPMSPSRNPMYGGIPDANNGQYYSPLGPNQQPSAAVPPNHYGFPTGPQGQVPTAGIPPHDSNTLWTAPPEPGLDVPLYEYEQQRRMDAERASAAVDVVGAAPAGQNPPQAPILSPPIPSPPAGRQALVASEPVPGSSAAFPEGLVTKLPPPNAGWEPLKVTRSVGGTSLHDGPAQPNAPDSQESPLSLTLSQDHFGEPFSSSFLGGGDGLHPPNRPTAEHRPVSAHSGYYTAEEDREMSPGPQMSGDFNEPSASTPGIAGLGPSLPLPRGANFNARRPRPESGYVPPASPPLRSSAGDHGYDDAYGATAPLKLNPNRMSQMYSPPAEADRYTRESYITDGSTNTLDNEDAVVVNIPPPEPLRAATPTMGAMTMSTAAAGAAGATISAAAFRRGARQRGSESSAPASPNSGARAPRGPAQLAPTVPRKAPPQDGNATQGPPPVPAPAPAATGGPMGARPAPSSSAYTLGAATAGGAAGVLGSAALGTAIRGRDTDEVAENEIPAAETADYEYPPDEYNLRQDEMPEYEKRQGEMAQYGYPQDQSAAQDEMQYPNDGHYAEDGQFAEDRQYAEDQTVRAEEDDGSLEPDEIVGGMPRRLPKLPSALRSAAHPAADATGGHAPRGLAAPAAANRALAQSELDEVAENGGESLGSAGEAAGDPADNPSGMRTPVELEYVFDVQGETDAPPSYHEMAVEPEAQAGPQAATEPRAEVTPV